MISLLGKYGKFTLNYKERSLLKLCTETQRKNKGTITKTIFGSVDYEAKKGKLKTKITGFSPNSSFYGNNSLAHYENFEMLKEVKRIVTYKYELELINPNNTYYKGRVIKKGTLIAGTNNKKKNIIDLLDLNLTINKYTNTYVLDEEVECIDGLLFSKKYKTQIIKEKEKRKCLYKKIGELKLNNIRGEN